MSAPIPLLTLGIVMPAKFNVVPFIVENEKCHFPLLSPRHSPCPYTNLKCLISSACSTV